MSNITGLIVAALLHPSWGWFKLFAWHVSYFIGVYLYCQWLPNMTFRDVASMLAVLFLCLITVVCFWVVEAIAWWELIQLGRLHWFCFTTPITGIIWDLLLFVICLARLHVPPGDYVQYLSRRYGLHRENLEACFMRHKLRSFPLDKLTEYIRVNGGGEANEKEESRLAADYLARLFSEFDQIDAMEMGYAFTIRQRSRLHGQVYELGIPSEEFCRYQSQ